MQKNARGRPQYNKIFVNLLETEEKVWLQFSFYFVYPFLNSSIYISDKLYANQASLLLKDSSSLIEDTAQLLKVMSLKLSCTVWASVHYYSLDVSEKNENFMPYFEISYKQICYWVTTFAETLGTLSY